jgi:hypothetical protein
MFGFLKKTKTCHQCKQEFSKTHTAYLPSFSGQLESEAVPLCNNCLKQATHSALKSFTAQLVYVEPLHDDNYGFFPFDESTNAEEVSIPLSSYFPAGSETCCQCSNRAQFAWAPEEAWDEEGDLKFQPKTLVSNSLSLCAEHLTNHFMQCIKNKNFYLHEHRLPYGNKNGGCY